MKLWIVNFKSHSWSATPVKHSPCPICPCKEWRENWKSKDKVGSSQRGNMSHFNNLKNVENVSQNILKLPHVNREPL